MKRRLLSKTEHKAEIRDQMAIEDVRFEFEQAISGVVVNLSNQARRSQRVTHHPCWSVNAVGLPLHQARRSDPWL